MATKEEVRQRVGEDLGLVPIGQTLEAQDQNRIDACFAETYERLKDRGLAIFPAAGPVPTNLVPSFCLLMCSRLLISYSVPESRYIRISNEAGPDGTLALGILSGFVSQAYESNSSVEDY